MSIYPHESDLKIISKASLLINQSVPGVEFKKGNSDYQDFLLYFYRNKKVGLSTKIPCF